MNDTTKWLAYKAIYTAGLNTSELVVELGQKSHPVLSMNSACKNQSDTTTFLTSTSTLKVYFKTMQAWRQRLSGEQGFISARWKSRQHDNWKQVQEHLKLDDESYRAEWPTYQQFFCCCWEGAAVRDLCACSLGWLTFPAALFAFALMFFVGKAVETEFKYALLARSHGFKSSTLTLVFLCGWSGTTAKILGRGRRKERAYKGMPGGSIIDWVRLRVARNLSKVTDILISGTRNIWIWNLN